MDDVRRTRWYLRRPVAVEGWVLSSSALPPVPAAAAAAATGGQIGAEGIFCSNNGGNIGQSS